MSKYKARKTVVNGVVFDSKKEADRFIELSLLQRAGAITGLKTQVKFELIPAQYEWMINPKTGATKKGKVIERAVNYIADFVYTENDRLVVEDTKGVKTKDYIIKRKLMLFRHGIKIREV